MGNPFSGPKIPKPPPPPAPPDTTAPLLAEISRQQIQKQIRQSKGRGQAFLSLDQPTGTEPYRAPGSSSTTGG